MVLRAWVSIIPIFFISDPVDIQSVLSSPKNTDKNFSYSLMHNFIGAGLITNSGK